MKIDYCSDLHVDSWLHSSSSNMSDPSNWEGEPHRSRFIHIKWNELKNADSTVLVIAGDTANNISYTDNIVACAAKYYDHVVFIEGNHENYDTDETVENNMVQLSRLVESYPNVHHLRPDRHVIIDGVAFVGGVGWYDFKAYEDRGIFESLAKRAWSQFSMDSRYPDFGSMKVEEHAKVQVLEMSEAISELTQHEDIKNIVMVTHMSPRADIMLWKENDAIWNSLTPSYVNTELETLLSVDTENKITHWFYGHTHFRRVDEIDGVTYCNNARGYPKENPPFVLQQIEILL